MIRDTSGRRFRVIAVAALLLPLAPAILVAQEDDPVDEDPGRPEVEAVIEGFHAALAAGDSTRALSYLHPDLIVYEAGHAETLAEYRSGHLAADMEFAAATETETVEVDVLVRPGGALEMREYRVRGTFRGRTIDASGVETLLLVPTDDGWKIRHIHWSSR